MHSSALEEQVILHRRPLHSCSHLLESHSSDLHPPPVQACVQFTMDEAQTNVLQLIPLISVQYCWHSSYGVVAPQMVEHGCEEQAPWLHVTLFDPGSQLVLVLAVCTKETVQDNMESTSRNPISIFFCSNP